jgi:hypothetical protein
VRIGKVIQLVIVVNFVYNNWDKSVAKKIDKKDFKIIDKYPNTKVMHKL